MAQLNYNTGDHEPAQGGEALPEGEYLVAIVQTEVVRNSNDNGTILKCWAEVLEGDCHGRRVYFGFNIEHTNPEAEKIGNSQLRALTDALGFEAGQIIEDSVELEGIPVGIVYGPQRKDPERMEVKRYIPEAEFGKAAAPKPAAKPKKANGAAKTPPYHRK